ncbi:NAD-dependent epimerase/dehydratase family protein [Rhizobacter sp. P5_C2]
MRLLVLGGGVFLGAAVVDAACAAGHAVTVFNRGRSRSAWPAGVECIVGDRQHDLGALRGRRFDAVVDTCGYLPGDVRLSAEAFVDAGQYLFVSSVSAYASLARPGEDERAPLAAFDGVPPDDRSVAHYGAQKAACEAALRAVWGGRALVVRPGLIVGPGDPTGRFSHWLWRAAAGGTMLVPDSPSPLQVIDVRDLAGWMVTLLEDGGSGDFNATGPVEGPLTWPRLIDACLAAAARAGHAPATPRVVSEAFLQAEGVRLWTELPLWIPASEADSQGFLAVSVARAQAAGLRTRPLHETAADILAEPIPAPDDARRQGKLTPQREQELLARWAKLAPPPP